MLETRIFGAALFLVSLVFIFHGCVLLFTPHRYLPLNAWGQPTIVFRKPSFELGKRFVGLCLVITIGWVFTRPSISIMVNPGTSSISWGSASLSHAGPRWDLLGVGVFALICGGLLFLRSDQSVEQLFMMDSARLRDHMTRKLWNIYVQLVGVFALLWSLLPLSAFIRSIR